MYDFADVVFKIVGGVTGLTDVEISANAVRYALKMAFVVS